jgi:lysophospholipase L1-like esterase
MRSAFARLFILCCIASFALVAGIAAAQEKSAEKAASPQTDKWEKDIAAMTAGDATNPPPKHGIVFVGSSSIRLWDLKKSFPELPVINRGFGGSHLADSVRYAERIVTPYQPKTIVLYAGDNDLAAKPPKTPEQIAKDFDAFVSIVRRSLPEAKIIFIPVKPSPSRWHLIDAQRETNELVRERCKQGENLVFLEIEKPMLGDDGKPREELFKQDMLHMNDEGYKVWAALLEPHLK